MAQTSPPLSSIDVASTTAIFFTWMAAAVGWFPTIAAVIVSLAGTIYYFLHIFSHPTVVRWLNERREKRIIKEKTKLLSMQLKMAREANGDKEFWETVSAETNKVLAELQQHALRQVREETIKWDEKPLERRKNDETKK